LQEQVNEKTVALSVKGAKITGRLLAKAMRAFLKRARASPKAKSGMQSVKSLTKQGASLANIEIAGNNIGGFKKTARKYNVDFALKRDDSGTPPKWVVFFKAKDADALTAAFNEYSKLALKVKTRKPSMLAKLNKFKELAKSLAAPVKNRNRGEREI
jgi:hypothetical protein